MKSTDYKVARNVVFSTPRLPLTSKAQISSTALCSHKSSAYVRDQVSDPLKKKNFSSVHLICLDIKMEEEKKIMYRIIASIP